MCDLPKTCRDCRNFEREKIDEDWVQESCRETGELVEGDEPPPDHCPKREKDDEKSETVTIPRPEFNRLKGLVNAVIFKFQTDETFKNSKWNDPCLGFYMHQRDQAEAQFLSIVAELQAAHETETNDGGKTE